MSINVPVMQAPFERILVFRVVQKVNSDGTSIARSIQAQIFYLIVVATVHSVCNFLLVYEPLIMRAGQLSTWPDVPFYAALTVLISTPVQIFLAWRIFIIMGSKLLGFIISLMALASCAGGFWTTASVSLNSGFRELSSFRVAPMTWLVTSAAADVCIVTCLVYSLSQKRSGNSAADSYITRIIRVTIQTGALTAVAALADAIVFFTVPGHTTYFIWDLSLSKLYISVILSSLNSRHIANPLFTSASPRHTVHTTNPSFDPQNATSDMDFDLDLQMGRSKQGYV
ncbi:hypothetical protein C8J56DRAFT_1118657 [Mycena floridula]|nr:hypothetical protein C8J56DRAFT_1118657 [Mycena floridula]